MGRMPPLQLQDAIEEVPGVGPARARLLRGAGILSVEDLLLYLPSRYEDRSRQIPVAQLRDGETAGVRGRVHSCRRVPGTRRRSRVEAQIRDDSGSVAAIWFNQPYVADQLPVGTDVLLFGRPAAYKYRLQLVNPVHVVIPADGGGADPLHVGRSVPVYRRIGALGPAGIRRLVAAALERLGDVQEGLPAAVCDAARLLPRATALAQVHYPPTGHDLDDYNARRSAAHRRLTLQEFVAFQAALALQRQRASAEPGIGRSFGPSRLRQIAAVFGFDLTAAQRRCVERIHVDLQEPFAMHRLLQGDVGSGKTAVAACALLGVALGGEQAALLAPTEILAEQQAATVSRWARAVGLEVKLLTGSTSGPERRALLGELESGQLPLVVGTHALLQPTVKFANLGLVVIDEQHRFGVEQRAALRAKGRRGAGHPDLLVMTATPIPRSLALTLYGDLEVSKIDQMPPGRSPVQTSVLGGDQWPRVVVEIEASVAAGDQVFVVSPRIEEADDDLRAATVIWEELAAALPAGSVGLLHGGLDTVDKASAMRAFVTGDTAVLVATTVVEVGVDVAAATLMVIEHAERFGLAQLHQLRGRVGRGSKPGRCVLMARGPLSVAAGKRLQTLCSTTDGFALAEQDLRLRGPGEVLGTRQAGSFGLRVGDPFDNPDWLVEAHEIAVALVASDAPEALEYRRQLRQQWRRRMQLARAG